MALVNMKELVDFPKLGLFEGVKKRSINEMVKKRTHVKKELADCSRVNTNKVSLAELQRNFQVQLAYQMVENDGKIVPTKMKGTQDDLKSLINIDF